MNGDAASVPSQVHLALGKTADTMTVAWTTMNATGSAAVPGVRYGPTTATDIIVNANANANSGGASAGGAGAGGGGGGAGGGVALPAYAAGDTRLLNVSGLRYTHVATMDGLVPGRAYTYQVDGDSTTFNFTFRRQGGAGGRSGPDRHIIFGDLGASHAFSICDACTAGADNCEASACVANRSSGLVAEIATADMMLHVGDFAYDFDGNGGLRGDQFMRNIEQVAAHVPYMVSHGNHEDSDVNLAHYIERFRSMPSNGIPSTVDTVAGPGVNTLWYSWDAGQWSCNCRLCTELHCTTLHCMGVLCDCTAIVWERREIERVYDTSSFPPTVQQQPSEWACTAHHF